MVGWWLPKLSMEAPGMNNGPLSAIDCVIEYQTV